MAGEGACSKGEVELLQPSSRDLDWDEVFKCDVRYFPAVRGEKRLPCVITALPARLVW